MPTAFICKDALTYCLLAVISYTILISICHKNMILLLLLNIFFVCIYRKKVHISFRRVCDIQNKRSSIMDCSARFQSIHQNRIPTDQWPVFCVFREEKQTGVYKKQFSPLSQKRLPKLWYLDKRWRKAQIEMAKNIYRSKHLNNS